MLIVKLHKKDFKSDFEYFLISIKKRAASDITFSASNVYVAQKDFLRLKKQTKKIINRKFRKYTQLYKQRMMNIMDLEYGPNESLAKIIKPGYILINI